MVPYLMLKIVTLVAVVSQPVVGSLTVINLVVGCHYFLPGQCLPSNHRASPSFGQYHIILLDVCEQLAQTRYISVVCVEQPAVKAVSSESLVWSTKHHITTSLVYSSSQSVAVWSWKTGPIVLIMGIVCHWRVGFQHRTFRFSDPPRQWCTIPITKTADHGTMHS